MFLMFSAHNYGAKADGAVGKKPLLWTRRLYNATKGELLKWFKDPNQPGNLTQENRSLLHDVLKSTFISQDVKNALLDRSNLDIDIKDKDGCTVLNYLIDECLLGILSGDMERLSHVNAVRKFRKHGARLENMSNDIKNKLLDAARLSLQQSYCQLLTIVDVALLWQRPQEKQSPLKDICLMCIRSDGGLEARQECRDYFINEPLALLLATRKVIINHKIDGKNIIQPTVCIQERYLQLKEFMPQSTIMQFLRLIVLSYKSSLIDVDLQKEERRMCAELEKPESDKGALQQQLQDLRNHKSQLLVLSAYHDFHTLCSEDLNA